MNTQFLFVYLLFLLASFGGGSQYVTSSLYVNLFINKSIHPSIHLKYAWHLYFQGKEDMVTALTQMGDMVEYESKNHPNKCEQNEAHYDKC